MKLIHTLKDNTSVEETYSCANITKRTTQKGKEYYQVVLRDKSASIIGYVWDIELACGNHEFKDGDFIKIVANVTMYNGVLQLNITKMESVNESLLDTSMYYPTTTKDVEMMINELYTYVDMISNPVLKCVVDHYYKYNSQFIALFRKHSAAKSVHHAFVGGLVEHTLGVLKIGKTICDGRPNINRDMVYAALLYHDIGKILELSEFPTNNYTDDGHLLGHLVMGVELINKAATSLPDELANTETTHVVLSELKHCVLAHHGKLEYGSPKKPATIEALAVHLADYTDSQLQIMEEVLDKQVGSEWTSYNRMFETATRRSILM